MSFIIQLTSYLAIIALTMAWTLRLSPIRVSAKILLSLVFITVSCYIPFSLGAILGYPSTSEIPPCANVVAMVAQDDTKNVDIWLMDGQRPRAYSLPINDKTRPIFKKVYEGMQTGKKMKIGFYCSASNKSGSGANGAHRTFTHGDGEQGELFIDEEPPLPPKDSN